MHVVDTTEALWYGLHLVRYAFALLAVVWFATLVTFVLVREGSGLLAVVVGFATGLVAVGGFLGLLYKVVADAVYTGHARADG